MQKIILIKFGDNDFYKTFIHAMEQLHKKDFIYDLNKKQIAFVFSEVLFTSYIIAQNNLAYNGLEKLDEKYIERMKGYFKLKPSKILTGDEVVVNEWDNSESFYMTPDDFGCF